MFWGRPQEQDLIKKQHIIQNMAQQGIRFIKRWWIGTKSWVKILKWDFRFVRTCRKTFTHLLLVTKVQVTGAVMPKPTSLQLPFPPVMEGYRNVSSALKCFQLQHPSSVSWVCPEVSSRLDMTQTTHPGGILVRCLNHFDWLLLMWRYVSSTLSHQWLVKSLSSKLWVQTTSFGRLGSVKKTKTQIFD